MGLKFLGTSVILERRHEQYDLARRVKAHYFESPNKNVVLKTFNDEFHRLTKSQTVTMSRARFDELQVSLRRGLTGL